jgi:hypothetical protein
MIKFKRTDWLNGVDLTLTRILKYGHEYYTENKIEFSYYAI